MYKFGDIVTFTDKAYKECIPSIKNKKNGFIGVCVDWDDRGDIVLVLFKGNKTAGLYSAEFIKKM